MKRSLMVLAFFSAFLVVSAAVYAVPAIPDSPTSLSTVIAAESLATSAHAESVMAADDNAQKFVGLSADQLLSKMGPANGVISDSRGGRIYIYKVDLANSNTGAHALNEYFVVGLDGTVTRASSVAD